MYKYRVIGYKTTGNGKRLYKIQDLTTGAVFEDYAKFFQEAGDDAFINVSVRGKSNFSILKVEKDTEKYKRMKELAKNRT